MIVSSNTHFPKDYKTGYRYCLMVNGDNKAYMVWNYIAREYMNICDYNGDNVNGQFTVQQVKDMYKKGKVGFYFTL